MVIWKRNIGCFDFAFAFAFAELRIKKARKGGKTSYDCNVSNFAFFYHKIQEDISKSRDFKAWALTGPGLRWTMARKGIRPIDPAISMQNWLLETWTTTKERSCVSLIIMIGNEEQLYEDKQVYEEQKEESKASA